MGLDLKPLVVREKSSIEAFMSRVVAIDAYNAMYQFMSSIRGADGAPLADSRGRPTSHLSGLFYRNIKFLAGGVRPVYVFDGKPPSLKAAEIERRRSAKRDAAVKYEQAVRKGDLESAKKYAQQTTAMRDEMVADAKKLLGMFGIPCVDAPSEGEAYAAHLTRQGLAHAAASQDYDSILFGATRLVRNFSLSGRRKLPNRNTYVDVEIEMISSQRTLDELGITREQLVDVGILVGTDFNPDGFSRVGPKTAIKLVREHGRLEDIPSIADELARVDHEAIRKIFLAEPEAPDTSLEAGEVDERAISSYLAGERSFSEERVSASLARLRRARERQSQNLDRWF
ncbi:MAG: flap endonuclease-1 [Thaumarchaeota archaeon]|nr:flap endonuclease-1 [Nitrososphaerota archaeon]